MFIQSLYEKMFIKLEYLLGKVSRDDKQLYYRYLYNVYK